jgi:O-succinylbenzoic acid--CoA ligase
VKFTAMVPLQVHESLKNGDNLGATDILLIGGGELHPALQRQLALLEKPAIYQSFAMTETYTHFALRRINGSLPETGFRPLPGVRITLDKRGCLEADIPGITPGKVHTNDLAEILGNGTFRWLGRFDNVINSGGIKIMPELVEQHITEVLGKECLVISERDERLGEKLVLLVETDEKNLDPDSLIKALRSRIPAYEIPRKILAVRQIPRNTSMKPDRIAARELI